MQKLKDTGKFDAPLSPPTLNCMQLLPWWRSS